MNIPKIRFSPVSLEDNIDIIKWIYYCKEDNLDYYNNAIFFYPELKSIDLGLSKDETDRIIEDIITKDYSSKLEDINKCILKYSELWSNYNDKYLSELSNYFDINLDIKEINAYIGFLPVFPRNLDDYSFYIGANMDDNEVLRVISHEVLHFYWFKKWEEIYSNTPKEHFESPFIEWKYSEMVTDPILNNSPFKELFPFKERGYDSFYKDNNIMNKLNEIYSSNKNICDKINEGFEFLRLNI